MFLRRVSWLFLFFSVLVFNLKAQQALQLENNFWLKEKGQSLSLSFQLAGLLGMVEELVYYDQEAKQNYDFLLSRLDWQCMPGVYLGINFSWEAVKGFWLAGGFWLAIPARCGIMENRDWDVATGEVFIYSWHENYLAGMQALDFNTGFGLYEDSAIVLNWLVGLNFQRIIFSGYNGYQESPPGTYIQSFSGMVIVYDLYYLCLYTGLETAFKLTDWLALDLRLAISPFLTFALGLDDHLLRTDVELFIDFPVWGFSLWAILSLVFKINNEMSLSLLNMFYYTPGFKGPSFYLFPESNKLYQSSTTLGGSQKIFYHIALSLILWL